MGAPCEIALTPDLHLDVDPADFKQDPVAENLRLNIINEVLCDVDTCARPSLYRNSHTFGPRPTTQCTPRAGDHLDVRDGRHYP